MLNREVTKGDVVRVAAKGLAGALPLVGALLAEIIEVVIPNQRIERLESFLKALDRKVSGIAPERLAERGRDEQFVDLFETGLWHAARAMSEERREQIASLIARGLT
jgi:hypothetical protein